MSVKQEQDGRWACDACLGGRKGERFRRKGFPSERAALDAVAVARDRYSRHIPLSAASEEVSTLRQVADHHVAWLKKMHRHPEYIQAAANAFLSFGELIPLDRPATEVTGETLEGYIILRSKSVKKATAFNDMIRVRAGLRGAAGKLPGLLAWVAPNISKEIRRPKSERDREFTEEEETKLIAAMVDAGDLSMADLFIIALDTGMRVSEIFSLRYSDVHTESSRDYPNGWLMARSTKTGSRANQETDNREVAMTERVAMVLASRRGTGDQVFPKVFDHAARMKKACKRAGIPYGMKIPNGVTFHTARHTGASTMLREGADVRSVMDVLGHKLMTTTQKYAHSTSKSRGEAIRKLEKRDSGK